MSVKISKISKTPTGYVVSENGTWVEGVYATEEAARKAVPIAPERLSQIWAAVLANDPDGVITEDDL